MEIKVHNLIITTLDESKKSLTIWNKKSDNELSKFTFDFIKIWILLYFEIVSFKFHELFPISGSKNCYLLYILILENFNPFSESTEKACLMSLQLTIPGVIQLQW